MKQVLVRGLTFANIVAVLALVVSLSGGVYAAAKINGKQIKNQSVAGKKLKKNTVTGAQIKESSLAGVAPASALAGYVPTSQLRRIRFERTVTGPQTTFNVATVGSLRVAVLCEGSTFRLRVSSTASSAAYDFSSVLALGSTETADVDGGLLDATGTNTGGASVPAGSFLRDVGTLVYNANPSRETVTLSFAMFGSLNGSELYCNLAATAYRTVG